jgi:hypothetical protein
MPLVDIQPNPPAAPTITNDVVSYSEFLKDPVWVQARAEDLTAQRFLADLIFSQGPTASNGAIGYDQLTANDLFLARDVKPRQPGGEYPFLTDQKPTPQIAPVADWGGRIEIFDEDIRRLRFDVVNREFIKLRNTIIRKVDSVAIAALVAETNKLSYAFGATWSASSSGIIPGLLAAALLGEQLDMGYVYDTLIINPAQASTLASYFIANKVLGEPAQEALVRGASVGRMLTYDIYMSNRVTAGTGFLVQRKVVGGISDEVPLTTKSYHEDSRDVTIVQGHRVFTPYITEPKACIYLTGL